MTATHKIYSWRNDRLPAGMRVAARVMLTYPAGEKAPARREFVPTTIYGDDEAEVRERAEAWWMRGVEERARKDLGRAEAQRLRQAGLLARRTPERADGR